MSVYDAITEVHIVARSTVAIIVNPFIHLRNEPEDQSDDEDELVVVCKQVTADMEAELLMSDGSRVKADHFEAGDEGCAIAVCVQLGEAWVTEVPNTYISDDGKTLLKPEIAHALAEETAAKKAQKEATKELKAVLKAAEKAEQAAAKEAAKIEKAAKKEAAKIAKATEKEAAKIEKAAEKEAAEGKGKAPAKRPAKKRLVDSEVCEPPTNKKNKKKKRRWRTRTASTKNRRRKRSPPWSTAQPSRNSWRHSQIKQSKTFPSAANRTRSTQRAKASRRKA